MSGGFPTAALRNAGGEAALKRVTIVASRPDDTLVYLQADYSAPEASATLTALPARLSPQASRGNPYHSSRGIELYSSTQGLLAETNMAHIDVFA